MKKINLSKNNLDKDNIQSIHLPSNIEELNLSCNSIGLSEDDHIRMSEEKNDISMLSFICNLVNLKKLNLAKTCIYDSDLALLSTFSFIVELNLAGTEAISFEKIKELKLTYLNISYCLPTAYSFQPRNYL